LNRGYSLLSCDGKGSTNLKNNAMANKHVHFITDEHLLACIRKLHESYRRAKANMSKKRFYANKVDAIKLTFDAKFNGVDEDTLVQGEILRRIDKSVNNAIGTFHEDVLGGIDGYETIKSVGVDIKAMDGTLFADIKNKHNTMNSSAAEALFQKLRRYADDHKNANCYWVQILAKESFCEPWHAEINGKEYSHSRFFKISGDRFYALLSGRDDALFQLYRSLPMAIDDYLASVGRDAGSRDRSALREIAAGAERSGRTILDQMAAENYGHYPGFDRL